MNAFNTELGYSNALSKAILWNLQTNDWKLYQKLLFSDDQTSDPTWNQQMQGTMRKLGAIATDPSPDLSVAVTCYVNDPDCLRGANAFYERQPNGVTINGKLIAKGTINLCQGFFSQPSTA
jgi:hypothetical protein